MSDMEKDKGMDEEQKTGAACLIYVAFGAFALLASIALGMLVGAWLGFAAAAAFVLLFILFMLAALRRMAKKNGDGGDS